MSLSIWLVIFAIALIASKVYSKSRRSVTRRIDGAFVIPGYPFVGNTFQVLNNPSKKFMEWKEKFNESIFVIHLGSKPVVIVNDRKDISYLWNRHSTALNSRPTSHTFHDVISSTQGPTIGTTPAGASFRKKRKILSSYVSTKRFSLDNHCESIDHCSQYATKNLLISTKYTDSNSVKDVCLLRDFQCYVLRCAIELTYGITMDTHGVDSQLANEIIRTENHIINFRSVISNYQDYLPMFRSFPLSALTKYNAETWKLKRDDYMDKLQSEFETNLQNNTSSSSRSMLASILSEVSEARILSFQETRSLCLTMISAGLDNLGYTMNHIMGQFSNPKNGQIIQDRLYCELLARSSNDVVKAWDDAASSMSCDFALAVIHEALRQFSVLPLGLPRLTTKNVQLGSITIPVDTILLMNVYAANHDPKAFEEPNEFRPQRWLDESGSLIDTTAACHYSFGLGSRKCVGDKLSIKEMYTLLCRIVLTFHVREPKDPMWIMDHDAFRSNSKPSATSLEPKEFRVTLSARQGEGVYALHKLILEHV